MIAPLSNGDGNCERLSCVSLSRNGNFSGCLNVFKHIIVISDVTLKHQMKQNKRSLLSFRIKMGIEFGRSGKKRKLKGRSAQDVITTNFYVN